MSTQERRILRSLFTKDANHLEELLKGVYDENEVKARFSSLTSKYNKIVEADDKIKTEMLSDENTKDEDLESELESTGNYEYRYFLLREMVDKLSKEDSLSNSLHSCGRELSSSGRLPEISNKFDGNLGNWIGFWTQFSRIHDSKTWEEEDKFEILIRSLKLGSSPRKLVQGFPPSKENYSKAVDLLRQRFGREELLIEYYVRQLLNLVLSKENVGLSDLYDRLETQLRALGSMGVTQEKYAAMLFPLVESAVPEPLFKIWERVRSNKNASMKKPDECLQELLEFLRVEVEGEERLKLRQGAFDEKNQRESTKPKAAKPEQVYPSAASLVSTDSFNKGRVATMQCIFCDKNHVSQECTTAVEQPLEKLNEMVKKKGACYKCLRTGHLANKCKAFLKCVICKGRHYPILCSGNKRTSDSPTTTPSEEKTEVGSYTTKVSSGSSRTYLQTLLVHLVTPSSETILVRALLDSGSMKSYISDSLVQKCCLEPVRSVKLAQELFGGHTTTLKTRNIYNVNLRSIDTNFEHSFDLIGQGQICGKLNRCQEPTVLTALEEKGVVLTDLSEEHGDEIEILLGADAWPAIYSGEHFVIDNMLALHTKLGWTVSGNVSESDRPTHSVIATSLLIRQTKEINLSNFWDLEVLGISDAMSKEQKMEQDAKFFQNFENSIQKNPEGRYIVQLPFKEGSPPLEDNRWHAESRLLTTTRKLKQQGLYATYDKVLQDWKDSSIVEMVPEEEIHKNSFYLPHRAVLKEESTTKCRPVFDAGCKDKYGHSLNELLEKGPNLIEKIPISLIHFRKGPIGISADIEKAFLQIIIDQRDRDNLRFLWWDKNQIVTLRHCRVVFGVSSSPFQLCAVLKHHLKQAPPCLEKTADRLLKAFYVDNCLYAVENEYEYETFRKEAEEIMQEAGFNLRGWTTNKHNPEKIENVLGLNWICGTDQLKLNIKNVLQDTTEMKWTRRTVLSYVQRIFDPIGIAVPFTLVPRIILQESWHLKSKWDDELPQELQERFQNWVKGIPCLHDCCINREIKVDDTAEVHVMCDASKLAYATCIFVVSTEENGNRNISLVMAKARVAPMKLLTIPRLELMAAVLGVRLYNSISSSLGVSEEKVNFWTDSSVVLSWINNHGPWSVFVSNRTQEIITRSNASQWKHLPGKENPADLLSRGCNGQRLISSKWWEGPGWLMLDSNHWPKSEDNKDFDLIDAERRKTVISAVVTETTNFTDSFKNLSDYRRIICVVTWILRWKNKKRGKFNGDEIKAAEKRLIKCMQDEYFTKDKSLDKTMLTVRDNDGLLRVKSKLLLAEEEVNFTCPILIPSDHFVTERMIRSYHLTNQHAPVSILLGIIREEFWIPRGRRTVKKVVYACVRCKRYNRSKPLEPPFAPLPKERVTQTAVFETSGVDLAGPMYLRGGGKVWIVIFTCAVYRAIHLELVDSLSTIAFIRALRRFIARRGRISVLYADNGTNFHGTSNYLSEFDWNEISNTTALKKITWKFNPPTAAWWGGWWERLIGLLKPLLVRNLGKASLTLDELNTLISECEALLNERPLTYVSDDSSELKPLKPSMFLRELPTCEVEDINQLDAAGLNRRLKYLQKIRKGLKNRFRTEYLALLVHNGNRKNQQAKVGDIVLIGSDLTKRIQWPMGRVIEVFPGPDGHARVAKVKTESGVYTRPLQRLYPLEICYFEDEGANEALEEGRLNGERTVRKNKKSELNERMVEEEMKTKCGRIIKKPRLLDI